MAYSKITSIEVTNFMVYKHAKIIFDEGNIINLKGYNSSGKSTMLKAIGVCLTNMFSNSQAKLIKHGEDFFRIVITFDDGISIVRDKYANGQSLYEMYKNGDLLLTTKEGRKLGKVSEVPQPIQEYLGLCVLQGGCLNYQSRQDRLWLIETKGSENYYSLNEILRTEEIARANQLINTDKNKLGGEIASIEATLNEVTTEIDRVSGVDERLLVALEEKEESCTALVNQYSRLKSLLGVVTELADLKEIPDVPRVDSSKLEYITRIASDIKGLETLKVAPKIPLVGISRLDSVSKLSDVAIELTSMNTVQYPELYSVEYSKVSPVSNIVSILEQLNKMSELKRGTEADIKTVNAKMKKAVELARADGKKFVQCDNCGTYMEVSVE